MGKLTLAVAQMANQVGDIEGNCDRILHLLEQAKKQNIALVIFPELVLTGYPPEDLLLRDSFHHRVTQAVARLQAEIDGVSAIIGLPIKQSGKLYNSAIYFNHSGQQEALWHKQALPNYSVFDEKRYFSVPANYVPEIIECSGVKLSCLICEDIWESQPIKSFEPDAVDCVIVINASPFHYNKQQQRRALLCERAQDQGVALCYAHCVGGQDELVFDGGSMLIDATGHIVGQAPFFKEALYPWIIDNQEQQKLSVLDSAVLPDDIELIYQALVTGTRDYVHRNGFSNVFIGASGGIDSALTLAIAVDALGAEHVTAVTMPSQHSASMSAKLAIEQAELLDCRCVQLPIESLFMAFESVLSAEFSGKPQDVTEENLQARIRGVLLMALANKAQGMVLTTGNKSEMAVGYATLYGDMAGGFAVLKDVFKTWVYRLAEYRNLKQLVIPQAVIKRPPTAELRQNQLDSDSLPPYPELDAILAAYIERDRGVDDIVAAGHDRALVLDILARVDRNEYKRRQAPPGVRVTEKAFGRDRRYPITSGYADKRV